MRKSTLKLLVMIALSQAVFLPHGRAQDQIQSSPREFCRSAGGTVSETDTAPVFICCYEGKRKCVLHNEQQRFSRIISITPEEQGLQTAQKSRDIHSEALPVRP